MKKYTKNIIAALCVAGFTFLTVYFQWFGNINLTLQDAVYQRAEAVNPSIKIIAIDEKTLSSLGQFETWTREVYARLIEQLNQEGSQPKAIGLDILIVNEKGPEDQILIDTCSKYDNVVMAKNLVFSTAIESKNGTLSVNHLNIDMVEYPFTGLAEHVHTGYANTVQDSRDNNVRYTILQQQGHKSFACALASLADNSFDPDAFPTDAYGGILIDYTGGSGSYETLSMIDVLEGKIPAQAFKDSIVLVGAYAAGMGDSYPVPSQKGAQMYGVEIHANILQGLLEERYLTQPGALPMALCYAGIAFAVALLAPVLKIWLNILLVAILAGGQFALCFVLDKQGLVLNMIALPIALLLVLIWSIIGKYAAEILQKRKIMQAFQKYVAPQVVEEISKNHDYKLMLGGEKRHIAVLFVDIRGFTPMSEALQPEQVVEILNEYLALVTDAIFKNGGTLDKFIGDAAMAVFNAPFDSDDYVYKAVCAARDIAAGGDRIAATFMERFGRTVSYGIGVNCGDAVVGNIGCDFRMDYTAIGDTVNTAARLESNAKAGQILISKHVYDRLQDRISVTEIGEIPLKGKSQGLMVYALDKIME